MADDLTFNKIAGAVLATGLVIFGLQNVIKIAFEREPPAKPGYAIAVANEGGSAAAQQDVIPDWGTVLPKADIAAGQAVTSKCQSCHQFDPAGTNAIGPGLYGVVGRPPGTHPGYSYDSAMQDFAKTHNAWTYDLLYQFLKAPGSFMPGTKMTFVGLKSPQDRINVIAYLRSNGSPNYPIPAPKPVKATSGQSSEAGVPTPQPGAAKPGQPVASSSAKAPAGPPSGPSTAPTQGETSAAKAG